MARIRSVKPEYWLDRKLARGASRDARLLYIGLWNHADEHGRMYGDSAVIKGQVFPYDDIQIDGLLDELEALGCVRRYSFEDDPYLFLPKLSKHQRLEPAKSASRLPEPPDRPDPPRPGAHSEKTSGESGPIAAESEPIVAQQVAGGRLQGAGSRGQGACGSSTREAAAAAELSELADQLTRVGIHVAFDADESGMLSVIESIHRCGIPALVKHAKSRHQRDQPAFSVRAFLAGWSALPAAPAKLELVDDPCEHGENHRSRCALCRTTNRAAS